MLSIQRKNCSKRSIVSIICSECMCTTGVLNISDDFIFSVHANPAATKATDKCGSNKYKLRAKMPVKTWICSLNCVVYAH